MNKNLAIAIALLVVFMAGIAGYLVTRDSHNLALPVEPVVPAAMPDQPAADTPVDFSLNDMDGEMRSLSDWSGKARLVNFWATWCAPCRREIPLLKETQADHEDSNVQVIGIAVDFLEEVRAYAEEAQFNYPILVGQTDAMAAAEQSGIEFIGLPFTLVIAPGGELLTTHVGEIVEAHIDTILEVFAAMENGSMDVAEAREALNNL